VKLCGQCNGMGFVEDDICERCGGEGLENMTTFVVGKINRRKQLDYDEVQEKKKHKFDKKNATRGGFY
jgi:DnaJ-class molecular chaperone